MQRILFNQIGFQSTWFACVWGGGNGWPWLGTLSAALWLGVHLRYFSTNPQADLKLAGIAGLLGVVTDAAMIGLGALAYEPGAIAPGLGPHWIVALWVGFSTTLTVSLAWLQPRPLLAAVMGAVFGPLAYIAGRAIGGVEFPNGTEYAMVVLALVWAASMPALALAAGWLHSDGSLDPPGVRG